MPQITVEMLPGRTPEVKKAIAKEVMERVAPLAKVPADSITVTIHDSAKEDWDQVVEERNHKDEEHLYTYESVK